MISPVDRTVLGRTVSTSESSILDLGAVHALVQKNLDASLSVLENRPNDEEEFARNDADEEKRDH